MSLAIRRELTKHAYEVGAILNLVQDDDAREELQAHFETALNNELWAGSQNRRDAAQHASNIIRLIENKMGRPLRAASNVIDLASRRKPEEAA